MENDNKMATILKCYTCFSFCLRSVRVIAMGILHSSIRLIRYMCENSAGAAQAHKIETHRVLATYQTFQF